MLTVADRIKEERERQGMTQDEFAKKLGYANRSAVSTIESKGNDLTLKKVKKCAEALGVTASFLMGWEGDEVSDEELLHVEQSAIRQKRIDKFPPDAIAELDNYIDYLEVKYSLK